MKLAIRAYLLTLLLLTFVFAVSAQTTTTNTNDDARSEKDPRNTAPTVGTGGSPGGPTGLFTVYDGQTLRRGEYTFSVAYSNFDRDPGDVDIVEVPVSFQVGLTNNLELFFNTDAYRAIKVNSPRNLSSFYLPNSQLNINGVLRSGPAVVLAPQGPGTSQFPNAAVFRPTGTQPFVQFPYFGGNAGTFGFSGPITAGGVFGFPTAVATLGGARAGNNGADLFPGIGSVYGSILPGVVLTTTPVTSVSGEAPLVYALAPSYLPDAPFINRTYGESAFNTFTAGLKWRWTSVNNPIGVGVIPFYRWYADKATDISGFNQLQRGASPGANRGDIGAIFFADARLRKWINISGNIGYIYNGDVKAEFPGGEATILDRGDELISAVAVDFPVNRYFQPILEFRSQQFVGGRTPNAFENNPLDGLAGVRIFPARWMGFSFAYRYHANQQDRDSFDEDQSITASVLVPCRPGQTNCTPTTITNTYRGVPPGFRTSTDPHGFIVQAFIGRRDDRRGEIKNEVANVTALTVSNKTISLGCPAGTRPAEGQSCADNQSVSVSTTAVDPEGDTLVYNYTVSGGKINGSGANVSWDLSGVRPGTYTITAGVDDGCGVCGQTKTETITVQECPNCEKICECGTLSVTGPAGITAPGSTMTFTANLTGGTQDAPTFNWTVSAGEIESGQGTPTITVRVPAEGVSNITANVEVGGLCEQCPNTGSETAPVDTTRPESRQVDEFDRATDDDVKARIDNFYIELNNNPNAQGYIINYGTPREIARRVAQINKAINFRKYDRSRIVFVEGGDTGEGVRTRLYIVPSGATPPTP